MSDEFFMKIDLKEAKKSAKIGEWPSGTKSKE